MLRNRILATGPVFPPLTDLLERHGPIEVADSTDEQNLIALMKDTIALIVRGTVQISSRVIEAASHLKVIGRTGAGYDNIDVAAATRRGIPIVYAPGAATRAVAEGTMALILALAKQLRELDKKTRRGGWNVRENMDCLDLECATLGIIGLGRIGQDVARLAHAFGMRVLACDPLVPVDVARALHVELVDQDFILTHSDYITFHVPLNEQTRGIINRRSLSLTRRGAILVNVSRGPVLENFDVLYDAMTSGQIAAVGLDVFPTEPPDLTHPIFQLPGLLCTPHVMGLSRKAARQTFEMVATGIATVLEGGVPYAMVNPEVYAIPGNSPRLT